MKYSGKQLYICNNDREQVQNDSSYLKDGWEFFKNKNVKTLNKIVLILVNTNEQFKKDEVPMQTVRPKDNLI